MVLSMAFASLWIILIYSVYFIDGFEQGTPDTRLVEARGRLLADLLKGYDKRVIPQNASYAPVTIAIDPILYTLKLFEHEEVMETGVALLMTWTDFRLAWDKHGIAENIKLPIGEIWQPDIVLANNADAQSDVSNHLVQIFRNGDVVYAPRTIFRTKCDMDMTRFPNDEQNCSIGLYSWAYSGDSISLKSLKRMHGDDNHDNPPVDLSLYHGNKEWEITSTSADIRKQTYECCPDQIHYSIWFSFKLKRNSVYYTYVFILPALILALLVPFQFVLPPDSKERLTFGSVLLLGIVILITMIQDYLPRAHTTLPYLVQYYCLTMVWIGLSMIFSIWVINIQNQALRKVKVPGFVRKIFLGPLKKVVCVNNYYYDTLYDVEPVSLREIKNKVDASEMSASGGDKTERSDKEIALDEVRLLQRNQLADARAHAQSEWYQVALVLDRIMCFLFCLVFIIYSCALLS